MAALSLTAAGPVPAHHSAAMFDFTRCLTLSGTVRTLEWNFPHVWLWVTVPEEPQLSGVWGFESGSPSSLTHKGWSRTVLKSGDKVTVRFFPLKNGKQGGNMATVRMADGRELPSVPFPCVDAVQPARLQ
jgi:hypothetical protein